ncbi:hypothetical protein [Streptomyces sp. NPDC051561]|uniref:hypothetical protein n=1 Tax=Streptomyces sp. NPDC051561 TaxID=3365658 RepID=UPI00378CE13F
MLTETAHENFTSFLRRPVPRRASFWLRVREYAVPPTMIETATARRLTGDWAGACAAAGFDVDFDLRTVKHTWGRDIAARLRDDLRRLAPDLLRWHMPRIAPDGLLRPGLTMSLARYGAERPDGPGTLHLVARTPPARADAVQRVSLALWDGSRATTHAVSRAAYPHPRPDRRFRLDLHRHLWDAGRADELRTRSGVELPLSSAAFMPDADTEWVPQGYLCAVDRWAAEVEILLRAEGRGPGPVAVRLGQRHRLLLEQADGEGGLRLTVLSADNTPADGSADNRAESVLVLSADNKPALPVLPDASTWVLPDLQLLRSGEITADRLHPLVAAALVPDAPAAGSGGAPAPFRPDEPRPVDCRGSRHRIGLVDGVLVALDHDPAELRREELLVALDGPPLPCLRAIDEAHRSPECLTGVRERLLHGDLTGALAIVEGLLGPEALLRDGALRDELEEVARRKVEYGLFRAGLALRHPGVRRRGKTDGRVPTAGNRR